MDETEVFFEDLRRDTVYSRGDRHIVLLSTELTVMLITVEITVTATGTALPPLLIRKGAKNLSRRSAQFTLSIKSEHG